jgi:hypothetical protein
VSAAYLAAIHLALGEHDQGFNWLNRADAEHVDWMIFLAVEKAFDSLRSDRRFSHLLARSGAPP